MYWVREVTCLVKRRRAEGVSQEACGGTIVCFEQ